VAGVRAWARYSPSTPMARVSRPSMVLLGLRRTELILMRVDFIWDDPVWGNVLWRHLQRWHAVPSFIPSPQLTITPAGTSVNLTWPSALAGFSYSGCTLQCAPNLGSTAVWCAVSCTNAVVNGQNIVTNPITGSQCFSGCASNKKRQRIGIIQRSVAPCRARAKRRWYACPSPV